MGNIYRSARQNKHLLCAMWCSAVREEQVQWGVPIAKKPFPILFVCCVYLETRRFGVKDFRPFACQTH